MQFFSRRHFLSPLLLVLVYFTFLTNSKSHHIRHLRDRFKRQQGAHLFLPGSYVTNGDDPDAGPWLDWATPSACSRTCGGGVSTQERQCTPGYTCQGPTKRHFSCNTQDCPDIADFRVQQCAEYDRILFEGAHYQWIPYTKAPNPCELNCMPRGERFYYRHSLHVVDGTKCDDEKLDVCVEGQCQPVGCDMMLGSNAQEDKCRVCDGDGSTCNTISGHLDMQDLQVGYNDILLIPAGAVNIRVAEVKPSNNYLAIRNTSGYYHLNGNWRIDFPRTLEFAGSKFHYDRYPQGFSAPDSISSIGPIDEAIFIVLLFQDVNVGIDYEYSVPKTVQHVTDTETYAWTFDEFTPCTVTCGGGYQYRNVTCAGRKSLEPVEPNLCDVNNKPSESQRCGEAPCEPRWVAKAWEKCSVPCGDGGEQTRQIYCEQIISSGVPSIVDDKQCANLEKPPTKQSCNQGVICATWHTGPWKPCDRLCGQGKEVRKVTCFRKVAGKIQALDDLECISKKPESKRACSIRPCEGVDWVTSEWSGCENKCGLSEETRRVQCATSKGEVYPDALCEESEAKPETVRKCQSTAAGCEHEWYASQWSECSAKCGSGVQTRKVFCALVTDDGFKKVEEGKCDPKKKYDATKNCTGPQDVCGGEWFTGPWSKCDKQCDGGVKSRKVICMKESLKVAVTECDADAIPLGSEECNKQACDEDELLPVEVSKPVTIASKATEPSIELVTDEYEIIEDEECEDGEWIDLESLPARAAPSKERLISLVGASTDSDKESTESTLVSEDLMLSDSTHAEDLRTTDIFTSEGSGDDDLTKVTVSSRAFSFTPPEGSGDTEVTITDADYTDYSDYTDEDITDGSGDEGTKPPSTEVSEVFSKSSAYTVSVDARSKASSELTTEASAEVTTKESDLTEGSGEVETTEIEKISTISQASAETSESASASEEATSTSGELPTTVEVSGETASTETTGLTSEEEGTEATPVTSETTPQVSAGSTDEISTEPTVEEEVSSTVAAVSTDSATEVSAESTVEVSTVSTDEVSTQSGVELSTESTEVEVSTVEVSAESTVEVSTESTVEVSTESTVEVSTESTVEVSTESTVEVSTESTVEVSTESTVEVSTESTVDVSTESTVDVSTESTVDVSTESTVEVSSESTVEVTTESAVEVSSESTTTDVVSESVSGVTTVSEVLATTTEASVNIGESDVGIDETAKPEKPSEITTTDKLDVSTEAISTEAAETVSTGATEKESEGPSTTEEAEVSGVSVATTESALSSTELEEAGASTTLAVVGSTEASPTPSEAGSTEAATTVSVVGSTEASTTPSEVGSTESAATTLSEVGSTEAAATTLSAVGSTEAATTPSEVGSTTPSSVESSTEAAATITELSTEKEEVKEATTELPESTESEEVVVTLISAEATTESEFATEYEVESTTELEESTEFSPLFTRITALSPELAARRFDVWTATTEEGVTEDVWGVTDVVDIFKPIAKKCRRKKKPSCKRTTFGCCADKVTPAQGPFDKGCPIPKTCNETTFGCCEDGVSPAKGPELKGCPPSTCAQTLFGCCPDQKTPAEGNDNEGCPPPPPECLFSEFGCCKDNVTEAQGPNEDGCEPEEIVTTEEVFTTTEMEDCTISEFGCCPDGISASEGEYFKGCDIFKDDCQQSYYKCCPDNKTSAEGPNYLGCKTECSTNPYGCCDDNITPAHGYNKEGCCLSTPYGCCPDNIKAAEGPNLEGCGCQYSPFRCCPDNVTAARGYNYEGCGCQHTQHGCCPDDYTPAAGANYTGCECHTYQFGCCPDGVTVARGPHQQGCGCRNTEFGCCTDDETPASGPNYEGCSCASSEFGCCLDGVTTAKGENYEECPDIPENLQASCSLTKERGTCRNYTVKWFYDMEYGGCSRFWYGGCDGNTNRFKSKEECQSVCVEPQGKDRCNLPQVSGPCEGYYPQWFYDKDRNHCAQFIYGGCLGNNNKFQSAEECNTLCVKDRNIDACEQPKEEGPCRGNFPRWFYDKDSSSCQQFIYGGCKGNNNNFLTESACKQKCAQPGRKKEYCSLPRAQGNCTERLPRWYYDASEKRCMPFYYSGCEGNNNNFVSQYHCEIDCPDDIVKDTCQLAAEVGECSNYTDRWYYDTTEKTCRQFYYGGCGGNKNNFVSEQACQKHCEGGTIDELTTVAPPEIEEPFKIEFCFLPSETGPCRKSEARWYYDKDGVCKQFLYGGCQGNRNNFKSSEECRQVCGNAQDICTLPKVVGPCDAEYEQWYYNQSTDACEIFKYGGCWGNENRFSDQVSCEQRCKRGPLSVTSAPKVTEPVPGEISICYNPVDAGTCNDSIPAFYYDPRSQKCATFIYSGCGGNANRYNSEEQCERQCGRFRGQDVCSLPRDVGPCDGYFVKAFYNVEIGKCEEFAFGGCEGNGNRFSSVEECESICVTREEKKPSEPHSAICQLPVDVGPCEGGSHKRWYFDDSRGECLAFIYSGCGGNFNRFKSFQACVDACREFMVRTESPNAIDSTLEGKDEHPCQQYADECATLLCPYGIEAYVDDTLCNKCKCHNPCSKQDCPNGTQCAIDPNRNRTSAQDPNFIAVCRETNKPGECPPLRADEEDCEEECKNDADCALDLKCCSTGCGTACVVPVTATEYPPAALITTSYLPAFTEAPVQAGLSPPELIEEEFKPVVQASEGDFVVLKCVVKGNPTPKITWSRDSVQIDGLEPRYRLLLSGALQIISLYKTDSGIYVCTADNKIGQPLQKEIKLEVLEPQNHPARISDIEVPPNVVIALGSPTILNCFAYGYPTPAITWWKNDNMIPLKTPEFTVQKDFSLQIHSVRLHNLGVYTCQAYNGYGKAASWSVTVQALGPVYSTNPNDKKYMKYVVDAPEKPTTTARPQYPYRPSRVSPTPSLLRSPTPYNYRTSPHYIVTTPTPTPRHTPAPPTSKPPTSTITSITTTSTPASASTPTTVPIVQSSPVYSVPVKANITLSNYIYPIGSDVSIPCEVEGYPIPEVQWYKDGQLILPSPSVLITETHRLILQKVSQTDSGEYRCEAWNQYSRSTSTTPLVIEGRVIHPNCTDNPYFANCELIVKAKYCTHKYYARFCCRSCTEAGLLPSYGPHLQQDDNKQSALQSNLV